MHISIWQQWASNHSTDFTVVGVFQTATEATLAATVAREFIQAVSAWYYAPGNEEVNHRREMAASISSNTLPPSPIEVEYSRKYGLNWNRGIDWVWPGELDKAVQSYERIVVIKNTSITYTGHPPFDQLLERLGGVVTKELERGGGIITTYIDCTAQTDAVAQRIAGEVVDFLTRVHHYLYDDVKQVSGPHPGGGPWDVYFDEGIAHSEGRNLSMRLFLIDILPDAPKFIEYLRRQGCTTITYRFVEE